MRKVLCSLINMAGMPCPYSCTGVGEREVRETGAPPSALQSRAVMSQFVAQVGHLPFGDGWSIVHYRGGGAYYLSHPPHPKPGPPRPPPPQGGPAALVSWGWGSAP